MHKKYFISFIIFIIGAALLNSQPMIREPKHNNYSEDLELSLISRGYTKIKYEDFQAVELFKSTYKEIYNKDYSSSIPTKVLNFLMSDGLYYSMLYDASELESGPLVTYLIFKDGESTFCFYKLNLKCEFSTIHWKGKTLSGDPSEEIFKVFY